MSFTVYTCIINIQTYSPVKSITITLQEKNMNLSVHSTLLQYVYCIGSVILHYTIILFLHYNHSILHINILTPLYQVDFKSRFLDLLFKNEEIKKKKRRNSAHFWTVICLLYVHFFPFSSHHFDSLWLCIVM